MLYFIALTSVLNFVATLTILVYVYKIFSRGMVQAERRSTIQRIASGLGREAPNGNRPNSPNNSSWY